MFQLYKNVSSSAKNIGQLTVTDLINQIKNNSQSLDINFIRFLISENGKEDKTASKLKAELPAFTPNSYSENGWRSAKRLNSTGYIYFDFDFDTIDEANDFKEKVKSIPYVFSSWLSVSNRGIGLLFKVDQQKVNLFNFKSYWNKINDQFFNGKSDSKTCDFKRLNIISYDPNIYVNEYPVEYDEPVEYVSSIRYKTELPFELVDHTKPYTNVDHPSITIDLYKLKRFKIKIGQRNSTLGAISMQLIFLNPEANYLQILNTVKMINRYYTVEPLSDKEVTNLVKANWNKRNNIINNENGIIDKYFKNKGLWFNPNIKLPLSEIRKISAEYRGNQTINKITTALNGKQGLFTTMSELVSYLVEQTGISKSTVYRLIKRVPFSQSILIYIKNNIAAVGKRDTLSDGEERIYYALEVLQDNQNKITQNRVAEYLGVSVKTIKRGWLPKFKDLVRGYNNSLVSNKKKVVQEIEDNQDLEVRFNPYYRNILNPLTDEHHFDQLIINLENSRFRKLVDTSSRNHSPSMHSQ